MEVVITTITSKSGMTLVHFSSAIGKGVGIWASKNKPLLSSKYHVEFDIDEELIWPNNIHKAKTEISFIKINPENLIQIQGKIEDIEDNGNICFMRLDSSLFMFSCANIPTNYRGYVVIAAKNIGIYDMNM